MKNIPLIILAPLIAVLAIVSIAMSIKIFSPPKQVVPVAARKTVYPDAVLQAEGGKPSTFLGGLFGQKTPTPTPSPATASDLSKELKSTYDDGGQSELDALEADASSL